MGQVPEALQLGSRDGRRMVMRRGSGVALGGGGGGGVGGGGGS